MNHSWVLFLIFSPWFSSAFHGDVEEILKLRAANNQAITDRDLGVMRSAWLPGIQVTISSGKHLDGADAYLSAFEKLFQDTPGASFRRSPERINLSEDGTVASEQGIWVGIYPGREVHETGGTYLACWRKDEQGAWRIAAELFVPLSSKR